MDSGGRASFAERLAALRDQASLSVAEALPRAAAVPADPEDRERVALAARHPRRVDAATVSALADVLTATHRLEDQSGSAEVLPKYPRQPRTGPKPAGRCPPTDP